MRTDVINNRSLYVLYLDEIKKFNEAKEPAINDCLENYFAHVSKTGNIIFSWDLVKRLIFYKTKESIEKLYVINIESENIDSKCNDDIYYEIMKTLILGLLEKFEECPFTMQRIMELIIDPSQNYNNVHKYLRGLEKNLLVVSSLVNESFKAEKSKKIQNNVGELAICLPVEDLHTSETILNTEEETIKLSNPSNLKDIGEYTSVLNQEEPLSKKQKLSE